MPIYTGSQLEFSSDEKDGAKGLTVAEIEAALEAHANRNQFNLQGPSSIEITTSRQVHPKTGEVIINNYYPEEITDPTTGIVLTREDMWTQAAVQLQGYHKIDINGDGVPDTYAIGYRAEVPPEVLEQLRADPNFMVNFEAIAKLVQSTGVDIDVYKLVPGYELQYNPITGQLVNEGPGQGTFNWAHPTLATWQDHLLLDTALHDVAPEYRQYPIMETPPCNDLNPLGNDSDAEALRTAEIERVAAERLQEQENLRTAEEERQDILVDQQLRTQETEALHLEERQQELERLRTVEEERQNAMFEQLRTQEVEAAHVEERQQELERLHAAEEERQNAMIEQQLRMQIEREQQEEYARLLRQEEQERQAPEPIMHTVEPVASPVTTYQPPVEPASLPSSPPETSPAPSSPDN